MVALKGMTQSNYLLSIVFSFNSHLIQLYKLMNVPRPSGP